jgi:hypothetical protein
MVTIATTTMSFMVKLLCSSDSIFCTSDTRKYIYEFIKNALKHLKMLLNNRIIPNIIYCSQWTFFGIFHFQQPIRNKPMVFPMMTFVEQFAYLAYLQQNFESILKSINKFRKYIQGVLYMSFFQKFALLCCFKRPY